MKRVLIKCGWLVTLDPKIGEIKGGELLFNGNTHRGRRPQSRRDGRRDDRRLRQDRDAGPRQRPHAHLGDGAARHRRGVDVGRLFQARAFQPRDALQAEDNYVANLIGALAQIDAGVTTLVDWCHNITTLEHAERAVDGLVDSGIRAVFAHGTAKPIGLETGTPFTHVPHPRERIEALRKGRLASDDGRVTLAMAILGPDWGAWEVVEHDIRMAREFGLVSSSHTRRREDCVVPDGYAQMAKAGLLGPDHNLVHGTSYDTRRPPRGRRLPARA